MNKSMIYKALVISVVSVFILTLTVFASSQYAEAACKKQGGDFIARVCIKVYTDGGKECSTSLDCEGRCYIHEKGQKPVCEYDNNPYKCAGTLNSHPINCN